MGVVISINGGPADALLMMSPQQFAAMAAAMELHPSRGGARCEISFRLVDMLHVQGYRRQPPGRAQQHARRDYSTLLVFGRRRRRPTKPKED